MVASNRPVIWVLHPRVLLSGGFLHAGGGCIVAGGESVIEHAIVSVALATRLNVVFGAWCLLIDIYGERFQRGTSTNTLLLRLYF